MHRLLAFALALAACSPPPPLVERPVEYVNPFIGSGGFGIRYGASFPGAVVPHGMAKVGPDTRGKWGNVTFLHYSGYWYDDDKIQGFSHLHLHGTGAADLGVLALMPTPAFEPTMTKAQGYESAFDKASEAASPGAYRVTLSRGDIRAELGVTGRGAHHRYRWAQGTSRGAVVFDLAHVLPGGKVEDAQLELLPAEQRLRGSFLSVGAMSRGFGGSRIYFEARTRQPWAQSWVWTSGQAPTEGTSVAGNEIGAALEFDFGGQAEVEVQLGLSLTYLEGAAKNLAQELPAWDLEQTWRGAEEAWAERLGRIRIYGGTEAERRIFYSALYRCFLMPTDYSDVDGHYFGQDGQVHRAEGFRYLSDLSLWDTYRTVHPLYALIAQDSGKDAVISLHQMAKEGGAFPRWPLATGETKVMLGSSAEIVLADAYLKGITGFEVRDAYARMRAAALDEVPPVGGRGGRDAVQEYLSLGYVPLPHGRPVSVTTEYAHADFALGLLAEALGEHADAEALRARSKGYRQLFEPASGFLWAKDAAGNFREGERDPTVWTEDFAEANAWQSLWLAQHDVDGLIGLLGGQQPFLDKLSQLFEGAVHHYATLDRTDLLLSNLPPPYYWHGNEPDIHAAYLFAQAGRPELTQRWVKWIRELEYTDGADGLAGNDDGGTLSAWYVFSALGLYPIAGSDRYVVGLPLFPKAELAVPGGLFTIEAEGASPENGYVQQVSLNGRALEAPEVRHADLRAGGTLKFVLGPKPSHWGRAAR
jgi:predicted alpha-1,2-mannosidase